MRTVVIGYWADLVFAVICSSAGYWKGSGCRYGDQILIWALVSIKKLDTIKVTRYWCGYQIPLKYIKWEKN